MEPRPKPYSASEVGDNVELEKNKVNPHSASEASFERKKELGEIKSNLNKAKEPTVGKQVSNEILKDEMLYSFFVSIKGVLIMAYLSHEPEEDNDNRKGEILLDRASDALDELVSSINKLLESKLPDDIYAELHTRFKPDLWNKFYKLSISLDKLGSALIPYSEDRPDEKKWKKFQDRMTTTQNDFNDFKIMSEKVIYEGKGKIIPENIENMIKKIKTDCLKIHNIVVNEVLPLIEKDQKRKMFSKNSFESDVEKINSEEHFIGRNKL